MSPKNTTSTGAKTATTRTSIGSQAAADEVYVNVLDLQGISGTLPSGAYDALADQRVPVSKAWAQSVGLWK